MDKDELIIQAEQILSSLIEGKKVKDLIPIEYVPEDMITFAKALNGIVDKIEECQNFAKSLTKGELDTSPPSRTNYLAGPLKELHSQLAGMSMSMKDLSAGKMVSKLYYPGELFENYNEIISMVSTMMQGNDKNAKAGNDSDSNQNVSSWSYHQVLAAINQLTTMVLQYDNKGQLVFANMAAQKEFENIEQLPETDKPLKNDLMSYLGKFTKIIHRMKPHEVFGSRFPIQTEISDNKTRRWYSIHTDVAKLTDGSIGVIHMIDDISEWKYNEEELRLEASLDPLTSAYTRKVGNVRFQALIDERNTSDNCVGFVDLDGLKYINDNHGHTEGDFAIKTVASILMSTVRDSDTVVRYGGDEFLILFKDCVESDAEHIIARMYGQLESINDALKKPYKIRFSIGVAYIDKDMDDMQYILDVIDEKMYENKAESKTQS